MVWCCEILEKKVSTLDLGTLVVKVVVCGFAVDRPLRLFVIWDCAVILSAERSWSNETAYSEVMLW